jgi:hypothetical protein
MPTGKVKILRRREEPASSVLMMARRSSFMPLHFPLAPRSRPEPELRSDSPTAGAQALSVRVLEAPRRLARLGRKPADDMSIIVEDLWVKLLDGIGCNTEARTATPTASTA